MRPLEAFWAAKIKITQNTKRDKESISFLKISDMTKRVPLNNFTADDGNPDDKRPRLDDEEKDETEGTEMPNSSSIPFRVNSNMLPSGTSSTLEDVFPTPSTTSSFSSSHPRTNGDFYANGNCNSGNCIGLYPDHLEGAAKCSICLWPIGSTRCYHGRNGMYDTLSPGPSTSHRPTTTSH